MLKYHIYTFKGIHCKLLLRDIFSTKFMIHEIYFGIKTDLLHLFLTLRSDIVLTEVCPLCWVDRAHVKKAAYSLLYLAKEANLNYYSSLTQISSKKCILNVTCLESQKYISCLKGR